jgi:hypothetical protein
LSQWWATWFPFERTLPWNSDRCWCTS